jgi:hypothetical protein
MKGYVGMKMRESMALVAILGLAVTGCDYIVPPIDFGTATPALQSEGWAGIVTNVTEAGGALHVDLAIVNNTHDWSAMDVATSTAKVIDAAGKSSDCSKVYVGTSVFVNDAGWYLPPGFVMKGYTGGTAAKPETRPLFVECTGVAKAAGQRLEVGYSYTTGPFNYYVPSHRFRDTLKLDLSKVASDTKYPIATDVAELVVSKPDAVIVGINKCTVQLTGVKRTDTGFEFSWESTNPTEYPAYVHIGEPPVIGADGILYGFYESPHLAMAPITPAKDKATWTTTVAAPADVSGFYILLPVETQQQKYFVDHVVDITDK